LRLINPFVFIKMKPASPKKVRNSASRAQSTRQRSPDSPGRAHELEEVLVSLQAENQQLQFDIGDRDVEMERMKITLFALNERVAMVAALKQDGDEQRTYLATSEYKRNDL